MPTGYTAPVVAGDVTDVKDFAAECAKAFGAFIHQRDDSPHAKLRYPKSNNKYLVESFDGARRDLANWFAMSEEEKYDEWSWYVSKQTVALHKSKAEDALKRQRYESMLAQVHALEVPSELENFKNFMVDQLEQSIKFDCGNEDFHDRYFRVLSYPEWCDTESKELRRHVSYYRDRLNEDKKRHAERVAYIDKMVKTFGFEVEK